MRISDWSSDVCSSDLLDQSINDVRCRVRRHLRRDAILLEPLGPADLGGSRSEEHTSELQSLMRISYAVFSLKKTIQQNGSHLRTLFCLDADFLHTRMSAIVVNHFVC